MSNETDVGFDHWCLVEIMGHNRYAGRVTEQTLAGSAMLRVEIPATSKQPAFSKFFNPSSVYSITPVDEAIARGLAEKIDHAPVVAYDLPGDFLGEMRKRQPKGLPLHPIDCDECDDDDHDAY